MNVLVVELHVVPVVDGDGDSPLRDSVVPEGRQVQDVLGSAKVQKINKEKKPMHVSASDKAVADMNRYHVLPKTSKSGEQAAVIFAPCVTLRTCTCQKW